MQAKRMVGMARAEKFPWDKKLEYDERRNASSHLAGPADSFRRAQPLEPPNH